MPSARELYLRAHDFLSSRLVRAALRGIQRTRAQTRQDPRHYRDGIQFRAESASWDLPRKNAWILSQTRKTVRYAYESTVYYKEIFDQIGFDPYADFGFDDFARVPVLERSTVQERLHDLQSNRVADFARVWNATGGSSGRPVEIQMGPEERAWRASGADYSMQRLGVVSGIRRALLWGHHLDPVGKDSMKDRVLNFAGNRRWYECLRLSPEALERYHADLGDYSPRCLVAYASALFTLADAIDRMRLPAPTYPSRCIVTGAEKLFSDQRRVVEAVFSVPVHERYGSRDVGDMGFQYEPWRSLAYSIDWALVHLEPANSNPNSDILITKLHGDAMPMIRYRTDDFGTFPSDSRPGHPTHRLDEVLGRRTDRIFRPDGSWVHGNHFPHLMKGFPVADFQIRQASDYSVVASVVLRDSSRLSVVRDIEANLRENLPDLQLEVSAVSSIPRGPANKWRPVISDILPHTLEVAHDK